MREGANPIRNASKEKPEDFQNEEEKLLGGMLRKTMERGNERR